MGDQVVILQGVESEESRLTLYSTVHGAGRVIGRRQAKGRFRLVHYRDGNKTGEFECLREPLVKREEMDA